MKTVLLIGTGSFIGGIARYLVSKGISGWLGAAFPFGTFVVNIVGCYLIGLFYGIGVRGHILDPAWRLFLTAGICGGFTTFSAFSNENLALLREGNWLYFALYASLSVFAGLLATWLGDATVRLFG